MAKVSHENFVLVFGWDLNYKPSGLQLINMLTRPPRQYNLQELYDSPTPARKRKCTLQRTLISSVVMYGSEASTMKQKDKNCLRTPNREVLRTVFCDAADRCVWRR